MTITALYIKASAFIIGPSTLPSLNGPYCNGGPVTRRERCKPMGIRYETCKLTTESEVNALKAVVLPILIRPSKAMKIVLNAIAWRGSVEDSFIYSGSGSG